MYHIELCICVLLSPVPFEPGARLFFVFHVIFQLDIQHGTERSSELSVIFQNFYCNEQGMRVVYEGWEHPI